ncbi:MarR family winged helix-turn-helix transcriptional regulator [Steroidobacter flavus]|uniref:MarR family winged helix-turn-helix transcriptional regulator n=1 Tax=Steroidobacter flavus TaxID=1842136 RepID=A0ABV8SKM6_9GAMM
MATSKASMSDAEYQQLADFRYALRLFLDFSARAARAAGLTPQQHQALLAIKGLSVGGQATIAMLAERLVCRHHSAVELVDRLVDSNLARRRVDPADRRRVDLVLTAKAQRILDRLSAAHLNELQALRPSLERVLRRDSPRD